MARVTVEDCINKVHDRFELVALSAQRAKDIASGEQLTIERNNEKDTVLSLREIAQETVKVDKLRDDLVRSFQRIRESEDEAGLAADENGEGISEASKELANLETEIGEPEAEIVAEKLAADDMSFESDNLQVDD